MVEMSEHSMSTEPVTLINVFEVPAEQVDAFIALWRDRAAIMSRQPGFRDSRLHRAISSDTRFPLVNVAHWDSQEAWQAAAANPEFQAALRELAEQPGVRFTAHPGLYRGVVSLTAHQ
jgi:heme oxygenase (mycobilin-producing)